MVELPDSQLGSSRACFQPAIEKTWRTDSASCYRKPVKIGFSVHEKVIGKRLGALARASVFAFACPLLSCNSSNDHAVSPASSSASESGAPAPSTDVPPFNGTESNWWLVQETAPTGRSDVLPAFEESARAYGCNTEPLGLDSVQDIYGERRTYHGISASCREGTIALITLRGGRIRIGCVKPTTREACDRLLRNIADAR
ncbi:MAG TPA: hypothetical protein VFQ61_21335 [Polyangiaceae bacterium]|nr:hypothetical protein [Polyangiaceae bacterium]